MPHDLRTIEGLAAALREAYRETDFILHWWLGSVAQTREAILPNWHYHINAQAKKYDVPPEAVTIGPFDPALYDASPSWRLHPQPTHTIHVDITDRQKGETWSRDVHCGLIDGEYRVCSNVPTEVPRKKKPPQDPIDYRPLVEPLRDALAQMMDRVAHVFAEKPLQAIRLISDRQLNGIGLRIFAYLAPFDEASWPTIPFTTEAPIGWPAANPVREALLAGAPEAILLDGSRVDLQQDQFDRQFPNWFGALNYYDQREKALLTAALSVLRAKRGEGAAALQELQALVIGGSREREPITKIDEVAGVAIYREMLAEERLPLSLSLLRTTIQLEYPAAPKDAVAKPKKLKTPGAITEAAAIKQIAKLIKRKKGEPIDAAALIAEFIRQYREVRIDEAKDSLTIEWGATPAPLTDKLIDTRGGKESDTKWTDQKLQWIGLTRQIDSGREDDNTALSLSFYFGEASGQEPNGMFEIWGLDDLDATMQKFHAIPAIQKMLASPATRVSTAASGVG